MLSLGCDAGIRYDERLEFDMIANPIGPRRRRFATATAPAYLERRGRSSHPCELLDHDCVRGRFPSGAMTDWEFERDGEMVKIEPTGPRIVRVGAATALAVDAAIAGVLLHIDTHDFEADERAGRSDRVLYPAIQPIGARTR